MTHYGSLCCPTRRPRHGPRQDTRQDRHRSRRGFGRLRKRPSGRRQAGYLHHGQLHYAPSTFPNKDAGAAWLGSERRLIDLGTWTPPADRMAKAAAKKITLADYASRWLEHRNISRRTRENYRYHLQLNILPVLGELVLTAITPEQIREWFSDLGDEHVTRNARAYGCLSAIFNTAVDDGLLDRSPARIKGASTVKHTKRQVVLLDPEQLAALADAMPADLRLIVLLAGWCGLRRGELFCLTRGDVAADGSTVQIHKGVVRVGREFVVGPPKTKESARTVSVPPHLRPLLMQHLAARVGPAKSALLFPDPVTGSFYAEGRFRAPFNAAKTAIGQPGLCFHHLRHYGGVMAAVAGGTTREVMDRLGHVTSTAAMRYQHTARGRADLLAERLSALAAPTTPSTEVPPNTSETSETR